MLGYEGSIVVADWPTFDASLTTVASATMIVQVNGKVRDRIEVPVSITEDQAVALALSSQKVLVHTGGNQPRKVIAKLPNVVSLVI